MRNQMNFRRLCPLTVAAAVLFAADGRGADGSRRDAGHGDKQEQLFTVGHTIRTLDVTGTLGETRPVNVHLWYPARHLEDCDNSGAVDHEGDDRGCSATPSVYTSRLFRMPLLPQWHPLSWTIGSSQAFDDFPMARRHRPFPVIIFSHGNQNNVVDYVYALEALAGHGFIVAAPDHLNNTDDDVRIDFINAAAGFGLLACFDGLPSPCSRPDVPKSLTDRVHDVSAVIDALPTWFGRRADVAHIGVLGHSRGTVTALAAAGGSTTWGFPAEPRVTAIMGLAIGGMAITFSANVSEINVPALLVAGTLDTTAPAAISQAAFEALGSTDKQFVLIQNAKHRHFDSGLCAETQSAGSIAQANPQAILDLQTIGSLVTFPSSGVSMDFCGFDTFTSPNDIRPLVSSLSGFDVTRTNVPATGLTSGSVEAEVVELAVGFFGRVLERNEQ
jgi:predicted dienelactone hydrolase